MRKKPNILLITTDYQAWEDNPVDLPFLDMPAMQRMADEGAICRQHYSSAPICIPARYTWVTGQYPHTHGAFDNQHGWVPDDSPIMMEHLKAAGYRNTSVGKMHFCPLDRMAGFDRRIIADQKEGRRNDDDYAKFLRAHGYPGNRIRLNNDELGEGEFYHCYDFPAPEEMHIDHYVGTQATQLIEQGELASDEEPWFLWVGFNGPHSPWDPPAEYAKPYLDMDLPKPRYRPGELDTKSSVTTQCRLVYTRDLCDYVDEHPEQRDSLFHSMRARHFGNMTLIDRQVEKMFAALEARGELDNTVIIWTADHGALLGDHDVIHKVLMLERSAHVPFFVRYPKSVPAGSRPDGMSGHVDLFPTLMNIAGARTPDLCEGRDVWPMVTGECDRVQDETFIEIRNDASIVTQEWKMMVQLAPWRPTDRPMLGGELYDRNVDPDEFVNVYDDPAYADVQAELFQRMCTYDPRLRSISGRGPAVDPLPQPTEYTFAQGEVCDRGSKRQPPHQPKRNMTLTLTLPAVNDESNGVLVSAGSFRFGYTLRLDEGVLRFATQRWQNEPVVLETPLAATAEPVNIAARWMRGGAIALCVNGTEVAAGNAGGDMPATTGREIRDTAGSVAVGRSINGPDCIPLLSDTPDDDTYTATITDVKLNLLNH